MATIKLTLGIHSEAVEEYNKILKMSPDYVPALKGLGETRLLQCKAAIREFLNGRAIDYCKEAIFNLARAAYKRPDFSCLWKLLGDCCSVVKVISNDMCTFHVPSVLLHSVQSIEEETKLEKMEILALGSRCYGMGIKFQPDCATLYSDLGVSYYNQAQLISQKVESNKLMLKAFISLEKSLQLEPNSYKQWNALGLIALSNDFDNKGLAQHCFIKSIKLEQNVVAWTNLAILYMQCEDISLAHEALKVAQSLEPSYVASWIGQALIAEAVGQSDEAMDLFRHSTELNIHTESSIGFAHHVCDVLMDVTKHNTDWNRYIIENMHAVTTASEVLAKYTDRVKTNATAYNLYGLLLERQQLFKSATEAFQTSLKLLEDKNCAEDILKAKINTARALVKNQEYESAVEIYENLNGGSTFEEKCNFALCLYHMQHYKDAFKQYEEALNLANTEEDKSHIYTAMGMVMYQQGKKESGYGDIEAAKTQLFKCIQSNCPSMFGLNGLLSLGLIQSDTTLAAAAVQELLQFDQVTLSPDFNYMVACIHALKGEVIEGKRSLVRIIHSHPQKAVSWRYLVQYLLAYESDLRDSVSRCCQIGIAMDVKNQYKELSTWFALALLGTGKHSRSTPRLNCHSTAQKAVFLYPDNMESWVALISTTYAEMVTVRCLNQKEKLSNTLLPLITHFMAKVESLLSQKEGNTPRLQALHLWCVKQYVLSLIAGGRSQQASQFLQQALWLYEEDQPLLNLLAFLSQNFNVLKLNAVNDSQGHIRQMLVKLYLEHGLLSDAEETYRMWLPQARTKPRKVLALVRLAFLAFKQLMSDNNTEAMQSIFNEAYSQCMNIDSQIPIFHLMSGILSVIQGNFKQVKKSLQTTLKYYDDHHQLSYGKSLIRKKLLLILKEKDDQEGIKELVLKATLEADCTFLDFANENIDMDSIIKTEEDSNIETTDTSS